MKWKIQGQQNRHFKIKFHKKFFFFNYWFYKKNFNVNNFFNNNRKTVLRNIDLPRNKRFRGFKTILFGKTAFRITAAAQSVGHRPRSKCKLATSTCCCCCFDDCSAARSILAGRIVRRVAAVNGFNGVKCNDVMTNFEYNTHCAYLF